MTARRESEDHTLDRMLDSMHDRMEYERQGAEQDAANRWLELWGSLSRLGVVDSSDANMTLAELEHAAQYLGGS